MESYVIQGLPDASAEKDVAGVHNWHIPRPSLIPSEKDSHSTQRGSASSQGSISTTSTQSGASGSLLLTAANLAQLASPARTRAWDAGSIASSEHFTVVNGLERRPTKPLPACCCPHRQISVLVTAMSAIFLAAILLAVLYLEMRWRDIRMFT